MDMSEDANGRAAAAEGKAPSGPRSERGAGVSAQAVPRAAGERSRKRPAQPVARNRRRGSAGDGGQGPAGAAASRDVPFGKTPAGTPAIVHDGRGR